MEGAAIAEVMSNSGYKLVKLANGVQSVHSLAFGETFHPVIGPVAEAEALYVRQLRLRERLENHRRPPQPSPLPLGGGEEFVMWDVGLGAAANAITVLRATRGIPCPIRLVSFDNTLEPLEFALQHTDPLQYLVGYEQHLHDLLNSQRALRATDDAVPQSQTVTFQDGDRLVTWDLYLGDFPSLLTEPAAQRLPKPHAIMFDAFSPAKNAAMWTEPLFANLFRLLDPERPCALPTYSRSTMLRVTLLLAGFLVGVGHATGEKEETTIAANTMDLISEPLDRRWLQRVRRSTSAEPLWEPVYRQAPLTQAAFERLQAHPQFA